MGLGPDSRPFIRVNDYIDDSEFPAIYQELEKNKHSLVPHTKGLVVNGIVPKEYNGGVKSIDSYLLNPEKYINFDYEQDIAHLDTLSKVKSYFYNKFNVPCGPLSPLNPCGPRLPCGPKLPCGPVLPPDCERANPTKFQSVQSGSLTSFAKIALVLLSGNFDAT